MTERVVRQYANFLPEGPVSVRHTLVPVCAGRALCNRHPCTPAAQSYPPAAWPDPPAQYHQHPETMANSNTILNETMANSNTILNETMANSNTILNETMANSNTILNETMANSNTILKTLCHQHSETMENSIIISRVKIVSCNWLTEVHPSMQLCTHKAM